MCVRMDRDYVHMGPLLQLMNELEAWREGFKGKGYRARLAYRARTSQYYKDLFATLSVSTRVMCKATADSICIVGLPRF